jgi:hypothetical protein
MNKGLNIPLFVFVVVWLRLFLLAGEPVVTWIKDFPFYQYKEAFYKSVLCQSSGKQ